MKLLSSTQTRRYRWLRSDVFKKTFVPALEKDARSLQAVLTATGEIPYAKDKKLQALIELLGKDCPKEKFLLFTQFADTAAYLNDALHAAGLDAVDCVTGSSENPAQQAWQFSPESNEKLADYPPQSQTRVLIATDILSEGQNLQDASRVINYDLPWAIIRLIQRAGRVDRIGQKAEIIDCHSFMPADGVDKIINLRNRLIQRLHENAEVVGSDESFFENQTAKDEEALAKPLQRRLGRPRRPARRRSRSHVRGFRNLVASHQEQS